VETTEPQEEFVARLQQAIVQLDEEHRVSALLASQTHSAQLEVEKRQRRATEDDLERWQETGRHLQESILRNGQDLDQALGDLGKSHSDLDREKQDSRKRFC